MITLTINEIMNSVPVLEKISKVSTNGIIAFQIARLIRELNKEIELFEKQRVEMIEKYCERDENGQMVMIDESQVKIQEDNIPKYNNDLRVILGTQIEINASKIPLASLEEIKISPQDALLIDNLVE